MLSQKIIDDNCLVAPLLQMALGIGDQFCLRWNNYHCNMTSVINQLLAEEAFVDVTLACDGARIKAHRV